MASANGLGQRDRKGGCLGRSGGMLEEASMGSPPGGFQETHYRHDSFHIMQALLLGTITGEG